MSYYITNIDGVVLDLGQIQSEQHEVDSDLDEQTYPTSGSRYTQVFDYGGVKRRITLRGTLYGSSQQALIDLILKLDALQTGDQNVVTYHSDFVNASTYTRPGFSYTLGIFSVKVKSFVWEYVFGTVLSATYTITMFESI